MIKYFPWPWGMPAPIWIRHMDTIKDLVTKFKLKPIDKAYHFDITTRTPIQMDQQFEKAFIKSEQLQILPFPWPKPCPGGMPGPHFHLGDKIFVVDTKVWKLFTKAVIIEFQEILEHSGSLDFEHTMELGQLNEQIRM